MKQLWQDDRPSLGTLTRDRSPGRHNTIQVRTANLPVGEWRRSVPRWTQLWLARVTVGEVISKSGNEFGFNYSDFR